MKRWTIIIAIGLMISAAGFTALNYPFYLEIQDNGKMTGGVCNTHAANTTGTTEMGQCHAYIYSTVTIFVGGALFACYGWIKKGEEKGRYSNEKA